MWWEEVLRIIFFKKKHISVKSIQRLLSKCVKMAPDSKGRSRCNANTGTARQGQCVAFVRLPQGDNDARTAEGIDANAMCSRKKCLGRATKNVIKMEGYALFRDGESQEYICFPPPWKSRTMHTAEQPDLNGEPTGSQLFPFSQYATLQRFLQLCSYQSILLTSEVLLLQR